MAPILSFDPERSVDVKSCASCGRGYTLVKGFILDDDEAHAVFFAALHDHGAKEAWIDVILGTFADVSIDDHVTFGCRVGAVGEHEPAATLVSAAAPYGEAPIFGRKLTRVDALVHPWLSAFRRIVDFILVSDPDVHFHVYG